MLLTILSKLPSTKKEVLAKKDGYIVTYMNPYNYLKLADKKELLENFDYITLDGIFLVKVFKFFKVIGTERLSPDFSSYFLDLFTEAESSKAPMYFVGTTADNLQLALENFGRKFPKLTIVGSHCGFMNADEMSQLFDEILLKNPEIVIVGMGVIHQENFLVELKKAGWKGRGYACGGFLHQSALKPVYYPEWISKLNLRWLYRIYTEPKLFFRYFGDYPKAFFNIVREIYQFKSGKSK